MTPEPDENTTHAAEQAQADAEEHAAGKPARQWREEASRIAAVQSDQVARAVEMGDRVEESIPSPDADADESPGVIAERDPGEARQASTGKRDAEHG